MKLDDLGLDDLIALGNTLHRFERAAQVLAVSGEYEPRFNLTPGVPALVVPPVFEGLAEPLEAFPAMPGEADFDGPMLVEMFGSTDIPSAGQVAPPPGPAEAPAGGDTAAGAADPLPADPGLSSGIGGGLSRSLPDCGAAGVAVEPAGSPVPEAAPSPTGEAAERTTPVPGEAAGEVRDSALPPPAAPEPVKLGPLTTEERWVIEAQWGAGASNDEIAKRLNRRVQTVATVVFNLEKRQREGKEKKTLDQVGAAIAKVRDAAAPTKSPDPAPAQADISPKAAQAAGPAAEGAVAAPSSAAPLFEDDLGRHLWNLPCKGDWHLAADRDLMQMSIDGLDIDQIATELGKHPADCKKRFMALRGQAGFPQAAVLDRLNRFLALLALAAEPAT